MNTKIVLAALIVLGLAACGQQEQATEESQAPVAAETPAVETAPADAAMETAPAMDAPALEGAEEAVDGETDTAAEEQPPVE